MSASTEFDSAALTLGSGFTVLSKTGCLFCDKVKELISTQLPHEALHVVTCDPFLSGAPREPFLAHVRSMTKAEQVRFPMVFHKGVFIGGYLSTKEYLEFGLHEV